MVDKLAELARACQGEPITRDELDKLITYHQDTIDDPSIKMSTRTYKRGIQTVAALKYYRYLLALVDQDPTRAGTEDEGGDR